MTLFINLRNVLTGMTTSHFILYIVELVSLTNFTESAQSTTEMKDSASKQELRGQADLGKIFCTWCGRRK